MFEPEKKHPHCFRRSIKAIREYNLTYLERITVFISHSFESSVCGLVDWLLPLHAKKKNVEKEVNLLTKVTKISTKTRHSLLWGSNKKNSDEHSVQYIIDNTLR